jgi:hypothetical protein
MLYRTVRIAQTSSLGLTAPALRGRADEVIE